jgi:hypothetical protein
VLHAVVTALLMLRAEPATRPTLAGE